MRFVGPEKNETEIVEIKLEKLYKYQEVPCLQSIECTEKPQ